MSTPNPPRFSLRPPPADTTRSGRPQPGDPSLPALTEAEVEALPWNVVDRAVEKACGRAASLGFGVLRRAVRIGVHLDAPVNAIAGDVCAVNTPTGTIARVHGAAAGLLAVARREGQTIHADELTELACVLRAAADIGEYRRQQHATRESYRGAVAACEKALALHARLDALVSGTTEALDVVHHRTSGELYVCTESRSGKTFVEYRTASAEYYTSPGLLRVDNKTAAFSLV